MKVKHGQGQDSIARQALLYERVKALTVHRVAEAERMPLLCLSHGTATRLKRAITQKGITLEEVLAMSPAELEGRHFPRKGARPPEERGFLEPDFRAMTRALMLSRNHGGGSSNRKLELMRRVVCEEMYLTPENEERCRREGLRLYTLAHVYRLWRNWERLCVAPSFRRTVGPGDAAEFDFTGVRLRCADGDVADFAVLVLCFSHTVYVEAIRSQSAMDSSAAIVHGFRHFGGVTDTLSIDNFKGGVSRPHWHGGELSQTFRMLSSFLGVTISAMPPRSPKSKGAAEAAVKIVTRVLLARMRMRERAHGPFASLAAMNDWLLRHLRLINGHAVRGMGCTRMELLESRERPALRQPGSWDFCPGDISERTVPPTARIEVGGHHYCLPPSLTGKRVQVEVRPSMVLFYDQGAPVCCYQRKDGDGGVSTRPGYNPAAHLVVESMRAAPISMYTEWAGAIGPETLRRVGAILGGAASVDKLRRAVKLLSLPRENTRCYAAFEEFLRSQPRSAGVGLLSDLWAAHKDKPSGFTRDPVYTFGNLCSAAQAVLFGNADSASWPAQGAGTGQGHGPGTTPSPQGRVFLNYRKDQE
ncbi:MAG: hypothetical protein K6A65_08695 [Succinivibrionaceae bacterium]|nr:hypothetical protein [Succinivibrionaceae bacterium]